MSFFPQLAAKGLLFAGVVALASSVLPSAHGRSLSDAFRRELDGLELEPLGRALAASVASTYPVASASSSVVFRYDPTLFTYVRDAGILGPIVGERAETIGRHRIDLSLSYSYVRPTSYNGHSLDRLVNAATLSGNRIVTLPVPGGVRLRDGRISTFLPIRVVADLEIEAQITAPAVTIGLSPDLDVNLTLPLIRTYLKVDADVEVPDPRLPMFSLAENDPNNRTEHRSSSSSAVGIGDILLRLKYVAMRGALANAALGLGVSFPTGDVEDFQGTGSFLIEPSLILSRVFGNRVELLLNAGVQINGDDVDRSVARWAAGGTGRIVGPLHAALVFLGRHEFGPQAQPIAAPFFVQIARSDQYDASIGLRWLVGETSVITANALVPLNEEGFRSDVIPTVQIEHVF